MIVLIILGIILLLLIILLNIPVRVRAAYYDKKLSYDVKYALFTVIDSEKEDNTDDTASKKPKKKKKGEEPPEDSDTSEDTENKPTQENDDKKKGKADGKKKKPRKSVSLIPKEHVADKIIAAFEGLSEKIDAVKLVIDLVWDDLIKLIKKVYFTGLVIDLASASEDAAEAAITYGRMNAVTYDAIATVKALTRLDVKSVRIDCLYDTPKDKSYYNGEITLRLRPASLVNAFFAVVFRFLFHIKKYKPILDTFLKK